MKQFESKAWKRIALGVLGLVVAVLGYGGLQLIEPVAIAPVEAASDDLSFDGRMLLVASDADMVATAYADAELNRVAGINDALTVVPLPLDLDNTAMTTLPVSNSVMSWPQIIAVSPNGQRAYVVEVRSHPDADIQQLDTIDDMPEGQTLTVVDLSDRNQPQVIETVEIGRNPGHISISPDGQWLAVSLEEPGRELAIIQLLPNGHLGQRTYLLIDEAPQDESGNRAVSWHPSGRFLAMTQGSDRQVAFYAIDLKPDGSATLRSHGDRLDVGNHLSNGRFTADGMFFLIPDLKWNTQPIRALNFLLNPKGEMIVIRFDQEGQHQVVSRAEVGVSPEGFALSPDNTLIATVNMRRTYLADFPPVWRGKPYSSLSLVSFDPITGQLTTIDDYGFEGLLPEQATFDAAGESLAVVIYNYREDRPTAGAVEFWAVEKGTSPRLARTGLTLEVVRGAHDIVLVK